MFELIIKKIFGINETHEESNVVEPSFEVLPEDYDMKEYKIKRKDDVKIYNIKRAKDREFEFITEFNEWSEHNKPI